MTKRERILFHLPWPRQFFLLVYIICIVCFHGSKADCVSSCVGKLPFPFTYPSCDSCKKYVSCDIFGRLTTTDCLLGMVYDETLRICLPFLGSCSDYSNSLTTKPSSLPPTVPSASSSAPSLVLKRLSPGQILSQNLYIKILLRAPACLVNASSFKSAAARSKAECASRCNFDPQCWYFQVKDRSCLMYALSIPPCNVYIYKYMG